MFKPYKIFKELRRNNVIILKFSEELWESVKDIYKAIIEHEFLKGLVTGSLGEEKFKFYVIQDALYLREFAKALSLAASKAPREDWLLTLNEHSKNTLIVERALHDSFFKDWRLSKEEVYSKPMSPTNLAYTNYLIAIAYSRPFHEVLGSLLPCYWIYWEVGKELSKRGSRKELYQRWIETYSAEDFGKVCLSVIDMMDNVSESLTLENKNSVKAHFTITSKYEYLFFDSAYKLEEWII